MQEIAKKDIELSDFSPQLRRIAEIMTNSIEFYSLKRACELANVNYDSARTMIARYRKRGIDFNEFVSSKSIELLRKGKYEVCRSLRNNAISGASADRKLFFQLSGDYKERQEIDHKVTGLHYVYAPSSKLEDMPEGIKKIREKTKPNGVQIIDVDLDD